MNSSSAPFSLDQEGEKKGSGRKARSNLVDGAEVSFFEKLQESLCIPKKEKEKETTMMAVKASDDFTSHPTIVGEIHKICGADAAYSKEDEVIAVASILLSEGEKDNNNSSGNRVLETYTYHGHFTFPYVSGLFFLHEGPFVVAAVKGLRNKPDIVCFDGHGLAHPRHLGLATICGVILGIPSIGLAKSRLVGESIEYKNGLEKVVYEGKEVGFITKFEGVKRYWSPGFLVTMEELEQIILNHSATCIKSIAESDQIARSDRHR